jgi:multiple sugar transport system permease protein
VASIPIQPVELLRPERRRRRLRRPGRPSLGRSALARTEAKWGLLFLSPWLFGFVAFTFLPMIASLAFSLTNISLTQAQPLRFVGLDNFARMLNDPQTWESLAVTFRFAAFNLPIAIVIPFVVALVLNSRYLRGVGIFRTLFFLPYVIPFVSGVLAWQGMLNLETGWVNEFLRMIGVEHPPNWLQDRALIYPSLAFIGLWGIGAGVIVNLAGLKGIPSELYDAARIDGAGWWAVLRNVTLPMMSPVIFYSLILGIVDVLQYFLVPLVLYNGTGEPGGSTLFFNLVIYKQAFNFQNFSYGATLAWLLFGITLAVTLVVFRTSRRWVYYAGER